MRKDVEKYPDTEPKTLGGLSDHYRKVYALRYRGKFEHHEAIHAVTGLGATPADESRIRAYEEALEDAPLPADEMAREVRKSHIQLQCFGPLPFTLMSIQKSRLHGVRLGCAMAASPAPTEEELVAHYQTGLKIQQRIKALTGKTFMQVEPEDIQKIKIADIDFTHDVLAIKRRLTSRKGYAAEKWLADLFEEASMKRRGQHMPAAFSPWHGPHRVLYKSVP